MSIVDEEQLFRRVFLQTRQPFVSRRISPSPFLISLEVNTDRHATFSDRPHKVSFAKSTVVGDVFALSLLTIRLKDEQELVSDLTERKKIYSPSCWFGWPCSYCIVPRCKFCVRWISQWLHPSTTVCDCHPYRTGDPYHQNHAWSRAQSPHRYLDHPSITSAPTDQRRCLPP